MADSGDPKATWSAYVRQWLGIRGWDSMKLVNQSGGDLNYKTVNKWVTAQAAASSDMAVVTAQTLGAPVADALRAAGHTKTAAALEHTQAAEDSQHPPVADLDPGIKEILAADLLTDAEKADFITHYQQDLELVRNQAAARARHMVRTVENTRRKSS